MLETHTDEEVAPWESKLTVHDPQLPNEEPQEVSSVAGIFGSFGEGRTVHGQIASTNPPMACEDLQQRMPRSEAAAIADRVKACAEKLFAGFEKPAN